MTKILITGATGLLGGRLIPFLKERNHNVASLSRIDSTDFNADLTNIEETVLALDQALPEVIINLAALTNVDLCNQHPQEAYLANVKTVENLCAWIKARNQPCHLIQISSDQVYDGAGPHNESTLTIRNHYAMSKLAGEFVAKSVESTILRTNFVGKSLHEGRISFSDWLYDALQNNVSINVFDDVKFSPLAITTLCKYIEHSVLERPIGVFNVGSRDGMSKADFAFAFALATRQSGTNMVRINATFNNSLTAPRPTDMRMDCKLFENRMSVKLPRLIDEIKLLADDYL